MLEKLKLMLGIASTETDLDKKLRLIIEGVTARLKRLLGGIDPPAELNDIILEVSIIRFNRIGSEGLTSHTVEGESLSFGDDDFEGYAAEIQAFLNTQKDSAKGKVRFL